MKNCKLLITTAAVVAFLSCLPAASAQTQGVLNLTACGGGGIQVTLTDIFFVTTSSPNRGCVTTGAPTSLKTGVGTVGAEVFGEILNLNVSVCGIFTIPGCVVQDFIRFNNLPNLHFDLSLIGPGPHSANCPNAFDPYQATCGVFVANPPALPYDSPFYLLATTTGTAINLPIFGQVRENNTVTASFIGTLSTQEVGTTPAGFQKKILTGGMQQSAFDLAMVVTPVPTVTSGGIVNAASNQGTSVAPGEIVTITGTNLSPVTSGLQLLPTGTVSPLGAGTLVLFDGVPAPLVSTSPTAISAVAPYEIKSTTVVQVLQSLVVSSVPVGVPVTATAPGIYTVSGTGTGQINMANQNGSLNSASNPAAKGTTVTFYATGEGMTSPAGADGVPTSLTAPGKPVATVTAMVGGAPASVVAVEAPGAVAGVLQVNLTVPSSATSGAAIPVVLTIGGVTSQSGATMAIQ